MRGAVIYAPGDVRVEDRDAPTIVAPTDAIIRLSATCVCGSDLWRWRGVETVDRPTPIGHEYVGIVEQVGDDVQNIAVGQFVVGSFMASDNTCEICKAGTRATARTASTPAKAARKPNCYGSRSRTAPWSPHRSYRRPTRSVSLLAASDVFGTGWFGAVAAAVGPGKTVVVVGDGAVGLLAVLSAKQLGAERIIAMSRHESRQQLAREFGATDIVVERGDDGVAAIKK